MTIKKNLNKMWVLLREKACRNKSNGGYMGEI